jgi:cation transport ATPase
MNYRRQLALLLFVLFSVVPVKAEEINLTINGMVCAFCAQGLADLARSFDPVQQAYVDMDNRLVVLSIKPDSSMSDDQVREYVKDAGYDLESFFRTDQSTEKNVQRLAGLLGRDLPSRPSSAYLIEVVGEDGKKYIFARLTIYRQHTRAWNRVLQPTDQALSLPVVELESLPWMPDSVTGHRHFRLNEALVSMAQSGTLVFLKIAL